jgi:hypothetical protein
MMKIEKIKGVVPMMGQKWMMKTEKIKGVVPMMGQK